MSKKDRLIEENAELKKQISSLTIQLNDKQYERTMSKITLIVTIILGVTAILADIFFRN
jgi:hypothetical protein